MAVDADGNPILPPSDEDEDEDSSASGKGKSRAADDEADGDGDDIVEEDDAETRPARTSNRTSTIASGTSSPLFIGGTEDSPSIQEGSAPMDVEITNDSIGELPFLIDLCIVPPCIPFPCFFIPPIHFVDLVPLWLPLSPRSLT